MKNRTQTTDISTVEKEGEGVIIYEFVQKTFAFAKFPSCEANHCLKPADV